MYRESRDAEKVVVMRCHIRNQFAISLFVSLCMCVGLQAQAPSNPSLDSISVNPPSLVGGNTAAGLVVLSGPATTRVTVSLSASVLPPASGTAPVTVPFAVVILAGEDRAGVQIATSV